MEAGEDQCLPNHFFVSPDAAGRVSSAAKYAPMPNSPAARTHQLFKRPCRLTSATQRKAKAICASPIVIPRPIRLVLPDHLLSPNAALERRAKEARSADVASLPPSVCYV